MSTTDATRCATCGGPFSSHRVIIDGSSYHQRCAIMSYPSHTPEDLNRMSGEIERLRAVLLNIQALAERGFPIDTTKLATRCRLALSNEQNGDD